MTIIDDIIKTECKDLGIHITIVYYHNQPTRYIFNDRAERNLYNIAGSFIIKDTYFVGKKAVT